MILSIVFVLEVRMDVQVFDTQVSILFTKFGLEITQKFHSFRQAITTHFPNIVKAFQVVTLLNGVSGWP
jgi:hypothetical protein